MVDQEPHRSVRLFRRIDTRIPTPLLSSNLKPPQSLGKLAELRASPVQTSDTPTPGRSQTTTPVLGAPSGGRGWTSIVARQQQSGQKPETNPTAWMTSTAPHVPKPFSNLAPTNQSHNPIQPSVPTPVSVETEINEDIPDSWEDDM